MFAHLMERLESYKDFGPPSLTKSVMRLDDKKFAIAYKEWDEELLDHEDPREVLMDNEETSDEEYTTENDDQKGSSRENDDQSNENDDQKALSTENDDQSSENDDQKGSNKENDDQPFTENSLKILDDKLEIDESSHVGAASQGIFFPDGCG